MTYKKEHVLFSLSWFLRETSLQINQLGVHPCWLDLVALLPLLTSLEAMPRALPDPELRDTRQQHSLGYAEPAVRSPGY